MTQNFDQNAAVSILNRILELELAGVVRYTHYALMVYGYNRIPIVGWLNAQADEMSRMVGQLQTMVGGAQSVVTKAVEVKAPPTVKWTAKKALVSHATVSNERRVAKPGHVIPLEDEDLKDF